MDNFLVAYFSATDTTREVARTLAEVLDADIYDIRPRVPYTAADLDWHDSEARSTVEMRDADNRPELMDNYAHIDRYGTIFLGFPIWWYTAPTIIHTFLEQYDFSSKTIVLFATSGGSQFGETLAALKKSAPDATFIEGGILNGRQTKRDLRKWVKEFI